MIGEEQRMRRHDQREYSNIYFVESYFAPTLVGCGYSWFRDGWRRVEGPCCIQKL